MRLSVEQFTRPLAYAHGSVRDQLLHLMDVDDVWFSQLQGVELLEPAAAAQGDDRPLLRARWDAIGSARAPTSPPCRTRGS